MFFRGLIDFPAIEGIAGLIWAPVFILAMVKSFYGKSPKARRLPGIYIKIQRLSEY